MTGTDAPRPGALTYSSVPISLRTNMSSLSMLRHLESSRLDLARATRRISSGLRIQNAADDPAGLAVSNKLHARVRLFAQGRRNVEDGLSLAGVADGAFAKISNILDRLREIAVQSSTDLVTNSQRGSLSAEFEELKSEIERIAQTTEFGGRKLLDGSLAAGPATSLQQAVIVGDGVQVTGLDEVETLTFEDFGLFAGLTEEQRQIELSVGQTHFAIIQAINNDPVLGARVRAASFLGRLELSAHTAGADAQFLVSSDREASDGSTGLGTILHYGYGVDASAATSGIAVQAGIDGTEDDRVAIGVGGVAGSDLGLPAARVDTNVRARSAIAVLEEAASNLQASRATLGSSMNRLATAAASLDTARENTAAAVSRIRDADLAVETARLTRAQILRSVTTSLLAQANAEPETALRLISAAVAPLRV